MLLSLYHVKPIKNKTMQREPFFQVVNSLKGCVPGVVYSTKEYSILKALEGNRGKENGIVQSRVKKFSDLITKNNGEGFYWGTIHVLVNLIGDSIDGNTRKTSLELNGEWVNFIITSEPKFNLADPSEILNNVSDLNKTSGWTSNEAFNSALISGERCALAIDMVLNRVSAKFGVKRSSLTTSRVLQLATAFSDGYENKSYPRRSYCNNDLANTIMSSEFNLLLDSLCGLIRLSKDNGIVRDWDVIKELSKRVIHEDDRDIIKYYMEYTYRVKRAKTIGIDELKGNENTDSIRTWVSKLYNV